jgi:hypothetical protein
VTATHCSIEQLVALRDGDRSEPTFAAGEAHLETCAQCRAELERLHQRTAQLRALPQMAPARNHFPAVRARLHWERKQRWQRLAAFGGLAAAASVALVMVGGDLVQPARLDAEQQLETAISRSQELERTLHDWNPETRVLDGRTARVVMDLEDRIAALDRRLDEVVRSTAEDRLEQQVALWQERVGLMNALVDVHLTRASNVDL